MTVEFPTNTVIAIIATMIASGTASWFIFSQGLRQLPIAQHSKQLWQWGVAMVLTIWLVARLALAANPTTGTVLASQFLITFSLLGLGLAAGILPLLMSPAFRQLIRAVPETWIVGVHIVRVAGFLFLALMDMNLLPAEFALSAGYGDITAGLLAIGMVYLLAKRKPYARALVIVWNLLGLLDFVSALATGGIYLVPFAGQVASSGISLLYLNFVLVVPSFGVPLYALLHLYSLFQMLSGRVNESTRHANKSTQAALVLGEQRSDTIGVL
jgi:hypothetical protein